MLLIVWQLYTLCIPGFSLVRNEMLIFQSLHQSIKSYLQEIETKAGEAEAILVRKMLHFKKQLQFFYVDLVDHRPTIPTEVERGYYFHFAITCHIACITQLSDSMCNGFLFCSKHIQIPLFINSPDFFICLLHLKVTCF